MNCTNGGFDCDFNCDGSRWMCSFLLCVAVEKFSSELQFEPEPFRTELQSSEIFQTLNWTWSSVLDGSGSNWSSELNFSTTNQGCSGIGKKDLGSIFFLRPFLLDWLTYLIRSPVTGGSKYGNVTLAVALFFFSFFFLRFMCNK